MAYENPRFFSRTAWLGVGLALLFFSTGGCTSLLYFPSRYEHVDRKKMPIQPHDVDFPSEDGTKLHGWYFQSTLPANDTADCALLMFHGNAENLSTHFFSLYSAPGRGYDYFIFDYRGYGGSEGSPSPQGTVEDGHAALRWLHEHHPEKKIVIFGQSLGGAIALRTAIDMKDKIPFVYVIADSTFASYKSVGRKVLAKHWLTWPFQPLAWLLLGDAWAPEKDLRKLSPVPLLVIHGDADQVVDYSMGEKLFSEAGEPKEFWRVPGGHHTDFMWAENGKFANRFFERLDQLCGKAPKSTL